jgi:hypothetical protein
LRLQSWVLLRIESGNGQKKVELDFHFQEKHIGLGQTEED